MTARPPVRRRRIDPVLPRGIVADHETRPVTVANLITPAPGASADVLAEALRDAVRAAVTEVAPAPLAAVPTPEAGVPLPGVVNEAQCYTVAEVARLLSVSPRTVRDRLRDGTLRGFREGADWRVWHRDLVAYIQGRRAAS